MSIYNNTYLISYYTIICILLDFIFLWPCGVTFHNTFFENVTSFLNIDLGVFSKFYSLWIYNITRIGLIFGVDTRNWCGISETKYKRSMNLPPV